MSGATVCLSRMAFVGSDGARLHCCLIGMLPGVTVVVGVASPRGCAAGCNCGCCCQFVCAAMFAGWCCSYLFIVLLDSEEFVAQQ